MAGKFRFTFAKVFIALAILFFISLGLCGLSGAGGTLPSSLQNNEYFAFAYIGLAVGGMLVSILGFIVTGIVWLVKRPSGGSGSGPAA
jgi:hypothetical protein